MTSKVFMRDGEEITRTSFECGSCGVTCTGEKNAVTGQVFIEHEDPKCDVFTVLNQEDGHALADFMRLYINKRNAAAVKI